MNSALIAAFIAALLVPWVFAVVTILIASRFRSDTGKRRQDFLTAIGLTVLMGADTILNMWMAHHIPHTIDARLWRWDETLRLDPMAVIYYMEEHGGLYDFMAAIYYSLPLVMAFAWIKEQSFTLRRAVAVAGVGGWILSAIFPAVGPHWYLDGYTVAMRHCIPAVEWSWALLLGWNARSWLRSPLWIYAALLAVASVLLSEHYLVDLIVAVPYTMAVQWEATRGHGLLPKAKATATVAPSSVAE
jgi:PAP2 superfamily